MMCYLAQITKVLCDVLTFVLCAVFTFKRVCTDRVRTFLYAFKMWKVWNAGQIVKQINFVNKFYQ